MNVSKNLQPHTIDVGIDVSIPDFSQTHLLAPTEIEVGDFEILAPDVGDPPLEGFEIEMEVEIESPRFSLRHLPASVRLRLRRL